jgi:hypothetical protein
VEAYNKTVHRYLIRRLLSAEFASENFSFDQELENFKNFYNNKRHSTTGMIPSQAIKFHKTNDAQKIQQVVEKRMKRIPKKLINI